jgi:hypothetical protein
MPFIPKDKSVPDNTLIHAAWRERRFVAGSEHLDLGTSWGIFYVENQPFETEGEWRVLSLLHFPTDAIEVQTKIMSSM